MQILAFFSELTMRKGRRRHFGDFIQIFHTIYDMGFHLLHIQPHYDGNICRGIEERGKCP